MRFLQLHRTYAACLLAALALGASCTKTVYDEGQQTQSPAISLSVTEVAQTRAMIDNTNFGKDGNRIQVYDFWTDGSTESKYIDAYAGPEVDSPSSQHIERTTWPFVDKSSGELVRYNWTSTGVHKFFGWLAVDATDSTEDESGNKTEVIMTAESFFGSGFSFNETSKVLTIPAKTLDQSTPQFDFLYSDIKTVKVTNGVPENVTVPMSFSHLFAAVSFGAKNTSNSVVKLLEFKVEKLNKAKSATIDFSGSTPTVVYADGSQDGVFRSVSYSDAAAVTVPKDGEGTMYNIFGKPGDMQEFTLIWPQTIDQLYSKDEVTEVDGNPVYPGSYKMSVKYTVDGVLFTKRINFDNTLAWEAGKKYHYDIIFADKMVELKCVVNPWDYVKENIDFKNQTVSVMDGNILSWDSSVSDVTNKKVAIKHNKPAVGKFTLNTPEGGRWFAYLSGDVDAFKIIDGEGPVGTPAKIQVQPVVDSPHRDYVVNVHFIVRTADGKTLDADSVLQPDVYSIILPKNK